MWRTRNLLCKDIPDLGELTHEVVLRMQAPRRVDEQHIDAARECGIGCVEGNRSRIRTSLAFHDVDSETLAPHCQLCNSARAKRVRSGEKDRAALVLETLGNLRDARCLSNAIHTNHKNNRRLLLSDRDGAGTLWPTSLETRLEILQRILTASDRS